ncbi:MAG TPA: hypothetical protein VIS07_21160 [Candidatus Binatia bacterium]
MSVDREIDRVRRDAVEAARVEAEQLRHAGEDRIFTVGAETLLQGRAEPPAEVDREDFARCARKVARALRSRGESLTGTVVKVRFEARSGRVVAVGVKSGDDASERQIYRRFDLAGGGLGR